MRAAPLILSVWPGLARLWLRGEAAGLVVAVGFGGLLQFALVTTFVWPQLFSAELPPWLTPTAAWVSVLGFWIAGLRSGLLLQRELQREARGDAAAVEPLLRQAQSEYLKGHWIEAETLLTQVLSQRPSDAEGRLLLASLYRRTRRCEEARDALEALSQLPSAGRWVGEIESELRLLKTNLETTQTVAAPLGKRAA